MPDDQTAIALPNNLYGIALILDEHVAAPIRQCLVCGQNRYLRTETGRGPAFALKDDCFELAVRRENSL